MGYTVEQFKYIPYDECDLQDLKPHLSLSLRGTRHTDLTPFENSLRASWAAMLDAYADYDEPIIFGECDACPRVHSTALSLYLNVAESLDFVRLHLWLERGAPDRLCETLKLVNFRDVIMAMRNLRVLSKMAQGEPIPSDLWRLECGTHALLSVRKSSRKKLAQIFRTVALPTDIALSYAVLSGELSVFTTPNNLFVQDELHTSSNK